jgi:hypothetical protein
MKRGICVIGLLAAISGALTAGPPCQDTNVSITISADYVSNGTALQSGIRPDPQGAYSGQINCNTGDLILNLNNSTRKIGFWFENLVASAASTPSWTNTLFYANGAYLVIGNIIYAKTGGPNPFTTTAQFSFTPPGGSAKKQDALCFGNPAAQVYRHYACATNVPYSTSPITVSYSASGTAETWVISPDNSNMNANGVPAARQVGDLAQPSGSTYMNAGQFSMPFQFVVTHN